LPKLRNATRILSSKGATMNRNIVSAVAGLVLLLGAGVSRAGWVEMSESGCQPWWNVFAQRSKGVSPEEERLQKFWHDYYDAMKNYYGELDRIDWVAYYKSHGYMVSGACPSCNGPGCSRIDYAPVFVAPTLQWAAPRNAGPGPSVGPPRGPVWPPPPDPGR
jgi:hypothetical protein